MEIKESDRIWVREHYPELKLETSSEGELVTGEFRFVAAWDESSRVYLVNPSHEQASGLVCIADCYSLQIRVGQNGVSLLETGDRILARARALGIVPADLHIYPTGELCPVGVFDLAGISSLQEYLDRPVLQFFYDQSYHERFGRWPRGQYLHGLLGLIESFCDQGERKMVTLADECLERLFDERVNSGQATRIRTAILSRARIQGHHECFCNSGRQFKNCHPSLFRGLWFLQKYVREKRELN